MASKPNNLSKARGQLLLSHPFFATMLLRTPMQILPKSEFPHPAATDGWCIMIQQEMLDNATPADLKTILCHEIAHMAFMHLTRLGGRNADLWNQAADHAINLMLKDLDLLKDVSCIPGNWLCDPAYKGMSADQIYDLLQKGQKDQKGGDASGGGGGGGKDKMHGDLQPSPMTEEQRCQVEQKIMSSVAAAASVARMQGKLNGELARMVGQVLEPEVPWFEQLRSYMTLSAQQHDNWARRNRRYRDVYLPTLDGKRMGDIVIIIDTSGSITDDDLRVVCSEVQGIEHQVQPQSIRVVWCDSRVAGEQEFQPGEFSFDALVPQGGGGTDMRKALTHVEQYDPLVCVLATDGFTPWPDVEPDYPLIVLCSTDVECPVGEVVRVRA